MKISINIIRNYKLYLPHITCCYVKSHCLPTVFGLRDSQLWVDEKSKFDRFCNRRLRHHCSCHCTYLITFTTLVQCYLQCIHITVILHILYMILKFTWSTRSLSLIWLLYLVFVHGYLLLYIYCLTSDWIPILNYALQVIQECMTLCNSTCIHFTRCYSACMTWTFLTHQNKCYNWYFLFFFSFFFWWIFAVIWGLYLDVSSSTVGHVWCGRHICSEANSNNVKYASALGHIVNCSTFIWGIYADIIISYLYMN